MAPRECLSRQHRRQIWIFSTEVGPSSHLNLETAVGSPILAQHLDSSSITKKVFITNKVTSDFFEKLSKSICYPKNVRPTAVSRLNDGAV